MTRSDRTVDRPHRAASLPGPFSRTPHAGSRAFLKRSLPEARASSYFRARWHGCPPTRFVCQLASARRRRRELGYAFSTGMVSRNSVAAADLGAAGRRLLRVASAQFFTFSVRVT